jgi:hypothetical protein
MAAFPRLLKGDGERIGICRRRFPGGAAIRLQDRWAGLDIVVAGAVAGGGLTR